MIDFSKGCNFIWEEESYPGVRRVAELVRQDLVQVIGQDIFFINLNQAQTENSVETNHQENLIIYGTLGKSSILDRLVQTGKIDTSKITGKREVYGIWLVEHPLPEVKMAVVIAGSDKRGAIYGLFHLSERFGVSPFVNWNHLKPKKTKIVLTKADEMISKEPSVKYRGFFINDEWPAFGTWATEHFGGINVACYERIFELLLRLKGNYLWPAMWRSNFNMDGPGLESAILADELGVVMSTSHHEPCMRAGEEYTLLRGPESIYGDAWNFRTNEEGITRFWRDGLLRNKDLESVITMGMRGERDSAILGKDAGLKANVDLLRDVLRTQNQLIRETMNPDLDQVPRQIVLFTEVEEFFYGNNNVKGLMGDPELDGVTLMLSDNNFGYTRTLPTEQMRKHKGGYGMYYHMDMHGGAHSYQWIGSTYLPRVWEQMTQAYEAGVQEIWVTNVGDVGTQEYGLSFFLDLAYDMEKWGGIDSAVTERYTTEWVRKQFGAIFPEEELTKVEKLIWGYTGLLAKRKHEIMNADIYHPLHFGEAQLILDTAEELLEEADGLYEICPKEQESSFVSLLYYPVCGTANLMKMWILAGRNKLYATQNRAMTNLLPEEIHKCLARDEELVRLYETIDGGYYKGFGTSPHIGFTNWNDEDCKYPILHTIIPAKEPRLLLARTNDDQYMTGQYWCDHPQVWEDFLRPDVSQITFELINGSKLPYRYQITTDCPWMDFSRTEGCVELGETISLTINRLAITGEESGQFCVKTYPVEMDNRSNPEREELAIAVVTVKANDGVVPNLPAGTFIEHHGYISMKAEHYAESYATKKGQFHLLKPYGREGSGMKVFPAMADFEQVEDRPYLEYKFSTKQAGKYQLRFYLAPTTPVCFESKQYLGFSMNNGLLRKVNTVWDEQKPFFLSRQWEQEAKDCVKIVDVQVDVVEGLNHLRLYAMNPGIVPEKIVLFREYKEAYDSYLGPTESYRVKQDSPVFINHYWEGKE